MTAWTAGFLNEIPHGALVLNLNTLKELLMSFSGVYPTGNRISPFGNWCSKIYFHCFC